MHQLVCANMQPAESNIGLKEDLTKEKVDMMPPQV